MLCQPSQPWCRASVSPSLLCLLIPGPVGKNCAGVPTLAWGPVPCPACGHCDWPCCAGDAREAARGRAAICTILSRFEQGAGAENVDISQADVGDQPPARAVCSHRRSPPGDRRRQLCGARGGWSVLPSGDVSASQLGVLVMGGRGDHCPTARLSGTRQQQGAGRSRWGLQSIPGLQ